MVTPIKKRIFLIGLLIAAVAAFVRDSSDTFDAAKLRLASRWTPQDAWRSTFVNLAKEDREKALEQLLRILKAFETAPEISLQVAFDAEGTLFGFLRIPPELASLLPLRLRALREARFSSSDGDRFRIEIPCGSPQELEDAELYLGGMKALLALEYEGEQEIEEGLQSLKLSRQEKSVIVDVQLSRATALFKRND